MPIDRIRSYVETLLVGGQPGVDCAIGNIHVEAAA
jgi:hypothetical protein